MVGLCRDCAAEKLECKGMKDIEKLDCKFFEKRIDDPVIKFIMDFNKMCSSINCPECELFSTDSNVNTVCMFDREQYSVEDAELMVAAVERFNRKKEEEKPLDDDLSYVLEQLRSLKSIFEACNVFTDDPHTRGLIDGLGYAIGGVEDVIINGRE